MKIYFYFSDTLFACYDQLFIQKNYLAAMYQKVNLLLITLLLSMISITFSAKAQNFDYPEYPGNDLGLTYTKLKSGIKIWAPVAEEVIFRLYEDGHTASLTETKSLKKSEKGTWSIEIPGDQYGKYYTLQAKIDGNWKNEVPDIYAKATGVNGKRAMITDLSRTNPPGWNQDKSPVYGEMKDAVLYELHVRDATQYTKTLHKGKFLGLTDLNLKNKKGATAGLAHIKELGVTHVHLLPVYDYYTVDESIKDNPQYNWGYDPLNYNVPEGGYSTNPFEAEVRIREFKTMIQAFHKNGLNVVMDVVYNHTMFGEESYFNQLVPGYYYRFKKDGKWSDASACGNETASEKPMFRKFMIESLEFWVKEYHIDGFRFDLMAIHDIETMNEIAKRLRAIKPDIMLYGEGWTAGDSPLPESKRALKKHAGQLNDIAVFCDDIRDGAKGNVFEHDDTGFISGKKNMEESIKFGLIGAGKHPDVDYSKVNYSKAPFTTKPYQMINYSECHDNHTLWDRWINSLPNSTEEEKINLQMLSLGIVLTGQGIPFIHAGQEFCRTKYGVENSYNSPDSINAINWDRKSEYKQVNDFTKSLIRIRRNHPAFRLGSEELVKKHVSFPVHEDGLIVMRIQKAPDDSWKDIYVVYNSRKSNVELNQIIPQNNELILSNKKKLTTKNMKMSVPAQSFSLFASK
jgi:pullulanase